MKRTAIYFLFAVVCYPVAFAWCGMLIANEPFHSDESAASSLDSSSRGFRVSEYNWTVSPKLPSSLAVGPNTITLPNCPKGLSTNDHFLYIAGTGIPEAVKVTVVNCTPGAGGTISLVATSVHGDGYTISSATGGIKEAWEDAHGVLVLPPGHIATMYAPLHLEKSNAYMDLSGATLVCNVPNNGPCVKIGNDSNPGAYSNISITNLTCKPGTKSTGPCLEDNAQHTRILGMTAMGNPGSYFGYYIQTDNDQSMEISGLNTNSTTALRCDMSFCGSAVYNPAGPDNAAVGWIHDSNISMGCSGNGVDWQGGNDLRLSNVILQAYSQWGLRFNRTANGADSRVVYNKVHNERGNCSNPWGNVGAAGTIMQGGALESDLQQSGGATPEFKINGTSGATLYHYYVQAINSVGSSNVLLAGYVRNGPGTINRAHAVSVVFPSIPNAKTCNLFRINADANGGDFPFGTPAAIQVATGLPCSNRSVNTFTDNVESPSSVTVSGSATWFPDLPYWPGGIILGGGNSTNPYQMSRYIGPGPVGFPLIEAGLGYGSYYSNGAGWFTAGQLSFSNNPVPVAPTSLNGIGVYIPNQQPRAVLIPFAAANSRFPRPIKGVLNLGYFRQPTGTDVITLLDQSYDATLGSASHRPGAGPRDTAISVDSGLAWRDPSSVSSYVNSLADGVNWKERLTATLKLLKVPVNAPAYQTATNCASATSAAGCGSAAAGSVVIAPGATTLTVNTTAVTDKSQIFLQEDTTRGTALAVTCNTTRGRTYTVTARNLGTSFTITASAAPMIDPACLSYHIVN